MSAEFTGPKNTDILPRLSPDLEGLSLNSDGVFPAYSAGSPP